MAAWQRLLLLRVLSSGGQLAKGRMGFHMPSLHTHHHEDRVDIRLQKQRHRQHELAPVASIPRSSRPAMLEKAASMDSTASPGAQRA